MRTYDVSVEIRYIHRQESRHYRLNHDAGVDANHSAVALRRGIALAFDELAADIGGGYELQSVNDTVKARGGR